MKYMKFAFLTLILVSLFYAHPVYAQSSKPAESPELAKSREITREVLKLFSEGEFEKALPLAQSALDLREKALGSNDQDLIPLLINLAEINNSLKRLEKSESFFNRALKIAEIAYGAEDIRIASILDRLAYVEAAMGHNDTLERVLIRSLKIREKSPGANDLEIAQTTYVLAQLYRVNSEYKKAVPLYQRAIELREHAAEYDHTSLIKALEGYVYVLIALKRTEEATKAQQRIGELSAQKATTQEGGVLNGKALVLPVPSYPMIALDEHLSGTVRVQVLIDERGNVISATALNARDAHPALVVAAEKAAMKARFAPTLLSGSPVKVNGIIVYNFVRH